MGKHYFTNEQIRELNSNPYVKKVTEKGITYKEEFKEIFLEKYENGVLPTQIFIECGFNPKILGQSRISNFAKRVHKQSGRSNGFTDTRTLNSGRPRIKGLSKEEEIERLKHKNDILKQENDFLKRVRYINKKQIWKQTKNKHQKKNSN